MSPLLRYVTTYRMQEKLKSGERTVTVSLKDDEMEFVSGHLIDGRNLFPATGYLVSKKNFDFIFFYKSLT